MSDPTGKQGLGSRFGLGATSPPRPPDPPTAVERPVVEAPAEDEAPAPTEERASTGGGAGRSRTRSRSADRASRQSATPPAATAGRGKPRQFYVPAALDRSLRTAAERDGRWLSEAFLVALDDHADALSEQSPAGQPGRRHRRRVANAVPLSLYLHDEDQDRLRELADGLGTSLSDVVSRILSAAYPPAVATDG